jgi:hypothetical protein
MCRLKAERLLMHWTSWLQIGQTNWLFSLISVSNSVRDCFDVECSLPLSLPGYVGDEFPILAMLFFSSSFSLALKK